jgi:VWFA-related protein
MDFIDDPRRVVSGWMMLAVVTAAAWRGPLSPAAQSAAADGSATGQTVSGDAQVFRASAELIRLDVTVTDSAGLTVSDLKAADFAVYQDGHRQTLRFADFRPAAGGATGAGGTAPAATVPPANLGATRVPGRRLAFVVDDRHMEFDSVAHVREELSTFLAERLLPGDHVLITGTRDGHSAVPAFTTDPAMIRREILALQWDPRSRNQAFESGSRGKCRQLPEDVLDSAADGTLAVLEEALVGMRPYSGRKTVMLLADGLDSGCIEYRSSLYERLRRMSDLAARSSATIYGLHTRPFSSGVRMAELRGTMRDVSGVPEASFVDNTVSHSLRRLAEPTGGFARRSNSVRDLLDAALGDQKGYYSLAYEPPPGTFTAKKLKYRALRVRINRKDLTVRTRGGFYSVTDDAVLLRH